MKSSIKRIMNRRKARDARAEAVTNKTIVTVLKTAYLGGHLTLVLKSLSLTSAADAAGRLDERIKAQGREISSLRAEVGNLQDALNNVEYDLMQMGHDKDHTPTVTVYPYLEDKAYGGPEEGGWWYTTRKVLYNGHREHRRMPLDEAIQFCHRANDLCHKLINRHRRSPSSVLSEGHVYYGWTLLPQPANEPRCKPHYE